MDAIHVCWLRAQRGRESDPHPVEPVSLHPTCFIKDTTAAARVSFCGGVGLGFQEVFSESKEHSSLHCSSVAEESEGKRSLCGTPSLAPNQAPPCGARTNRQPAAEVKD